MRKINHFEALIVVTYVYVGMYVFRLYFLYYAKVKNK